MVAVRRGALFSLALVVGLHLLGLPGWLALGGGVFGGITLHRSLPPKLGDPESWRRFQESHPDSIGKKGGSK